MGFDNGLTYEQEYEIDFSVVFADSRVSVEYAGCGSHQIKMSGRIELQEARRLHTALGDLPGIKEG